MTRLGYFAKSGLGLKISDKSSPHIFDDFWSYIENHSFLCSTFWSTLVENLATFCSDNWSHWRLPDLEIKKQLKIFSQNIDSYPIKGRAIFESSATTNGGTKPIA